MNTEYTSAARNGRAASIRKSGKNPGVYYVDPEPGSTRQSIGEMEWNVGDRYTLEKVLGYGSFSCVCLAKDVGGGRRGNLGGGVQGGESREAGEEWVALKRIGDVLYSDEQAKRVLRELAILRRIRHPNVIRLKDAFVRPSGTGQYRMVGGKLMCCSLDLYIATEYAQGGDLFHMMGQLSGEEVVSIMWQLLHAVKYLHSMNVWHRDVKSQNAFIVWENGERVVKLGDFGSARSACAEAVSSTPTYVEDDQGAEKETKIQLHQASSFKTMEEAMEGNDLYAAPKSQGGFSAPLTRVVATPCYRAPEVVMSRGGYTDAIDMWGIGCIMGEILQRVAYVGSATTPHLQIAPLFALQGMPKTPNNGETFGRPESETTRKELEALFDVIGTPAWYDADQMEMEEWKRYLANLPGKAPSLYRRFKSAGEVAVHLLSRLLEFDPKRRISCEEALDHEFFSGLKECLEEQMETDHASKSYLIDAASAFATIDNRTVETNIMEDLSNSSPSRLTIEDNPGKALALMEMHVEKVLMENNNGNGGAANGRTVAATSQLRTMLEAECKAVEEGFVASRDISPRSVPKTNGMKRHQSSGFLEDQAASGQITSDFGRDRLSNVADTWQGKELDPRKFLKPHRHGEWMPNACPNRTVSEGPRWGVTSVAPGIDETDPRAREIIKNQQGR